LVLPNSVLKLLAPFTFNRKRVIIVHFLNKCYYIPVNVTKKEAFNFRKKLAHCFYVFDAFSDGLLKILTEGQISKKNEKSRDEK